MYGRFLEEAAAITGEGQLRAKGEEMRQIGDVWQEVAQLFKESSAANASSACLVKAARLMTDVADREELAWKGLQEQSEAWKSA